MALSPFRITIHVLLADPQGTLWEGMDGRIIGSADNGGTWDMSLTEAGQLYDLALAIGGLPSALSINFLAAADKFMGNFLLIAGGFFTSLLVGYRLLAQADAELGDGLDSVAARRTWAYLVRYLAPVVLLVVMILMVPAAWEAIKPVIGLDG